MCTDLGVLEEGRGECVIGLGPLGPTTGLLGIQGDHSMSLYSGFPLCQRRISTDWILLLGEGGCPDGSVWSLLSELCRHKWRLLSDWVEARKPEGRWLGANP